ncbi:hypothetical protein OF83DRAFT_1176191 [Amylostereum chailletii]|nr:hypothetical protein OF83DRAFT_1176191 [Amylostereum chailletii]
MAAVHEASLVPASEHSPELLDILEQTVNRDVLDYYTTKAHEFVRPTSGRPSFSRKVCLALVVDLIEIARLKMNIVLVALTYLKRVGPKLDLPAPDGFYYELVCFGALSLAHKYVSEDHITTFEWSIFAPEFNMRLINRVEMAFLNTLGWNLRISEDDVLEHYASLAGILPNLPSTASLPASLTIADDIISSHSSSETSIPSSSTHRSFSLPATLEDALTRATTATLWAAACVNTAFSTFSVIHMIPNVTSILASKASASSPQPHTPEPELNSPLVQEITKKGQLSFNCITLVLGTAGSVTFLTMAAWMLPSHIPTGAHASAPLS